MHVLLIVLIYLCCLTMYIKKFYIRFLWQVVAKCRELGRPDGIYHYISADMSNLTSTELVIKVREITQKQLSNFTFIHLGCQGLSKVKK